MARRSGARRSDSAGAAGAGAWPAFGYFSTARNRSMSAASEAAPSTRAPRKGVLQEAEPAVPEREAREAFSTLVMVMGVGVNSFTVDGMSLTVTDRLPFPFNRPGMYSSSTAWKLVPPKPKALKPARRTPSGGMVQGFSSVLT